MSLNISLLSAVSGLRAVQTGIDLVSRNIANVNTPGYTRKTAPVEALILDGDVRGVVTLEIQRSVEADIQRQFRRETSISKQLEVKNESLATLEVLFGRPDDAASIASDLGALNDAFIELANSPESATQQTAVINAASALADNLNLLSSQITTIRNQAESGILDSVRTINTTVESIHKLNLQIADRVNAGQSAADLQDRRDALTDALSEEIDITYFIKSNGAIFISTAGGKALLDERPHLLEFEPQNVTAASKYTSPTLYPTSAPNLGGVVLDGVDVTERFRAGRLTGQLELRDAILPQAQAQLDEFSAVLLSELEAADLRLFVDPANPPPGPYPYPGAEIGLAGRIAVNDAVIQETWRLRDGTTVAVEGANPGDDTLIKTVIDSVLNSTLTFRTAGLGPGATPDLASGLEAQATLKQFAGSFVSFQANQKANIDTSLTSQNILAGALNNRLTGNSGVNLDQELATMIQLQNSYAASAKTVQTLQSMYDDLLSMI